MSATKNLPSRTFDVKVAEEGENFLVRLPFDVVEVFGRARPPVVIDVDGYRFRSTVAVYGGEYFIGIRRSHREAAVSSGARRTSSGRGSRTYVYSGTSSAVLRGAGDTRAGRTGRTSCGARWTP